MNNSPPKVFKKKKTRRIRAKGDANTKRSKRKSEKSNGKGDKKRKIRVYQEE